MSTKKRRGFARGLAAILTAVCLQSTLVLAYVPEQAGAADSAQSVEAEAQYDLAAEAEEVAEAVSTEGIQGVEDAQGAAGAA